MILKTNVIVIIIRMNLFLSIILFLTKLLDMKRKCCVQNCSMTYKWCKNVVAGPKIKIFSFPNNDVEKNVWLQKIPGPLNNSKFICENHFEESQIIRKETFGGVVKIYNRPQLKKNAVPSVFENYQSKFSEVEPNQIYEVEDNNKNEVESVMETNEKNSMSAGPSIECVTADLIRDFEQLKGSINKIDLSGFDIKITSENILIYKLNIDYKKSLKISFSIFIEKNLEVKELEVKIFYNNIAQTFGELKGIIKNDLKIIFFSQIQKILFKYSNPNIILSETNYEKHVKFAIENLSSAKSIISESETFQYKNNIDLINRSA